MSQQKEKHHIWHNMKPDQVASVLKTDLKHGLSDQEVAMRQKFGANKLPDEKKVSKFRILFDQFKSPLIYILIIAGVATLFLGETADSFVILMAVALNTVVGYFQESKASNTLSALKKVLKVKALVIRDGIERQIAQEELVAGDLIVLKSGNKVPADGRIVESHNLSIQEAALTGEWLSSAKTTKIMPTGAPLADRDSMAYMGTIIEDGEGKALVVGIGSKTEIGKVANLIEQTKEEKTPYQKKLARFSKIIGIVVAVVVVAIFLEGMLTGAGEAGLTFMERFKEMFVVAVAVAVAAIPEGLPIAMTVILAIGMQRILKRKGLVRKLTSAETLGSTTIIATDKTLTLTQGKMEVAEISSCDKNLTLTIAALSNEAFIENADSHFAKWQVKGRPTDRALVVAAAKNNILKPELEKQFPKIDEIVFNTKNKYIATLHQVLGSNNKVSSYKLFVAGAPEKIIALSKNIKTVSGSKVLTKKSQATLITDLERLTSKGLRVVAMAQRNLRAVNEQDTKTNSFVNELTFVGFIGLKDPLRPEAKEAFALAAKAGLRPIIVTGDHLLTAKAVGAELGLSLKKESIMLGVELDKLSDEQLGRKLSSIKIFARVEPSHKLRIIEAWQAKKQVVAMTGDGINDAPALKKADIGVAIGSGTDVAKEVSDLVLLNDNFSIIVAAIEEGRAILDNIRKVITYLLADSFTEMMLIGVAIVAKLPLPITAVQILWVNLIEDGLPNIALAFEPKENDLMESSQNSHNAPLLTREMKVIIFIIGLVTDLFLLIMFLWLYFKFGVARIGYVRTMIFAGLTIDSLFYIFSCKSLRRNLWHINIFSNKYLIGAWAFGLVALLGGIYLPFLQGLLKTVPLTGFDWMLLMGLGFSKLALIELAKYHFIVRHKTNI